MKKLPIINNQAIEFEFESLFDKFAPIYFDNNSTTFCDDDCITAMLKAMEINYANPSGKHSAGNLAKNGIESARNDIAKFIGCNSSEILFTSGGTESIITAINSAIKTHYPRQHFVTCVTEHKAVLNKLEDVKKENDKYQISYLKVDKNGYFDLKQLDEFLSKNPHTNLLVSLMAANNETGTIHHNIFDAIKLAHMYESLIHIDAVQIAGKIPIKPYIDAGVEFLTIAPHKLHGPKGIGILYIKNNMPFYPTIVGGSQESNRRGGTENVPSIVGFAAVAKKELTYLNIVSPLHRLFIKLLSEKIPSCIINGGDMPGTINVGFRYVHRDAMITKLSEYGLYASIGSACSKGITPSHVLEAMNVPPDYLHGSIRFSFSKYTTENEIIKAIKIIDRSYSEIRILSVGIFGN